MTRILVIDTAGPQVRIELGVESQINLSRRFASSGHVRELTVHLRDSLQMVGWELNSIGVVGVNIGPGSFTGIRVGLALTKAFAYTLGLKLVGVDMFDVFGLGQWPNECERMDVILEGQLRSIMAARYLRHEGEVQRGAIQVFPRDELGHHIDPDVGVTGLLDRVQSDLPNSTRLYGSPPWEENRPSIYPIVVSRAIETRFDDPFALEPYYVRPSSAEEKWDAKIG